MDKAIRVSTSSGKYLGAHRSGSVGPVNGSIRLPNGDSFRYVRGDIMRDAIDQVTHGGQRKPK